MIATQDAASAVVSSSLRLHGLWPPGSSCPWDFPGKNTGMGCHFLVQGIVSTQRPNLHLQLGWQVLYHWATWEALLHGYCITDREIQSVIPSVCLLLNEDTYSSLCIGLNYFGILDTSHSVQFSSVAQSCPTLCDPVNHSMPGLPVHHQLLEFTETHVHRVSDAIQPSHPLSSPSPPAPNPSQHQSLFQWVNSSHEVAKVLEFQL